jgi:hypothetical protein
MSANEVGGGFQGQVIENQRAVLQRLADALDGKLGAEQQMLAAAGIEQINFLSAKNEDYGSAVFKKPMLADISPDVSILVRLSDKYSRIDSLVHKGVTIAALAATPNAEPAVKTESLEDSLDDLAGYWLLRKAIVKLQKFLSSDTPRLPLE